MRVEILPHAWQHGITGDEMRAVPPYPLLRHAITTPHPDADSYMFVGRIGQEPWIEVAVIDLRARVMRQRPFIGPQYGKEN